MSTEHIVALLISERDKLNRAIEALGTSVKRRGRPPKNSEPEPVAPRGGSVSSGQPAKKRGWSAAAKKAQGERMKAFWSKRRKQTTKS
jgi:hypothetical protein